MNTAAPWQIRLRKAARRTLARHREDIACIVLTIALAIITAAPVLFLGQLPFDKRELDSRVPWSLAPTTTDASPRPLSAQLAYYIPSYRYLASTNDTGRSIQWNPNEFGGMPFAAAWRTRAYSPFSMPFHMFGFTTAFGLSVLLKFCVAGLGAFYAARRLGLSPPFALLAAVAFQQSAPLLLFVSVPFGDTIVWFPLIFVFLERLAFGQFVHWSGGAMVWALIILGGSPESLIGVLVTCFVYLVVRHRFVRSEHGWRTSFGLLGLTLIAGALLCAVQLLGFLEFRQNVTAVRSLADNPPMSVLHLAVPIVLLAGVWVAMRHYVSENHRHRIDTTGITALILLLLAALAQPAFEGIPVLSMLELHHLTGGVPFVLAIGACSAAEGWLELNPTQCQTVLKRLLLIVPMIIVPALILSVLPTDIAGIVAGERLPVLALLVVPALFGGIFLFTLFRPSARIMGYSLALLTFVELAVSIWPQRTYSPADALEFPASQSEVFACEGYLGGGSTLMDTPLSIEGVRQLRGAGPYVPDAFHGWLDKSKVDASLLTEMPTDRMFLTASDLAEGLYSARDRLQLLAVFPEGSAAFKNLAARPLFEYIPNPDPNATQTAASDTAVTPVENKGDRLVFNLLDVDTGRLVVWQGNFPGWIADVDGVPIDIEPYAGVFQSVSVTRGDHQAALKYRPKALLVGRWLGIIAAAVVILNQINVIRRNRAARNTRMAGW